MNLFCLSCLGPEQKVPRIDHVSEKHIFLGIGSIRHSELRILEKM